MIKYLNRDVIILFLCLLLSLLLYFSSKSPVVYSVKAEIADFILIVTYPQTYYSNLMTIKKDNELLKQKLVQMNMLNSELIHYEHENSVLKNLLDFYDEQPWSLKIAKVVNDNYSYLMRTITINLGMKDVSWIGSHPIAGTEQSGPSAGDKDLFKERWSILSPPKTHNNCLLYTSDAADE